MKIMPNTMSGLAAVKSGSAEVSSLSLGQKALGGGLEAINNQFGVDFIGSDTTDTDDGSVAQSEIHAFESEVVDDEQVFR